MLDPTALDALPPDYAGLLDAATEVFGRDDRVRGLWIGGSVARGLADAGSDLDLIVAIRDEDIQGFFDDWRGWLAAITPTVYTRLTPLFLVSVTDHCARLDVVIERVGDLPRSPFRDRLTVFDRDELTPQVPPAEPPPPADPARASAIAEEFLRHQAIFPAAVVAREDWLLAVVGVQDSQRMLYQLFEESNRPLPPMGVKQWSAKLTAQQRDVLLSLPSPTPDPSAIEAMRLTAQAVRTHGRAALERIGGCWPSELDAAVLAFWDERLPLARSGDL